jgi:hypothetical protein
MNAQPSALASRARLTQVRAGDLVQIRGGGSQPQIQGGRPRWEQTLCDRPGNDQEAACYGRGPVQQVHCQVPVPAPQVSPRTFWHR